MPYFGTMEFDASASDFEFKWLESVNFEAMDDDGDGNLVVTNVWGNTDVVILMKGFAGTYGTWSVDIRCESMSPTQSPSDFPTTEPTMNPTPMPSVEPTSGPTMEPSPSPTDSDSPTLSPSEHPTKEPSGAPITPAPLHVGEFECGQTVFGDYNDESLDFEVRMPFEGDMTFDASDSDFEVTVLESLNFEAMDDDGDGVLLISNLPAGADVIVLLGAAEGTKGAWSVVIECESASPTVSPSSMPTVPTPYPTGEPTAWPTSQFAVEWYYTMTLNESYEQLVNYMFGTESTMEEIAADVIHSAMSELAPFVTLSVLEVSGDTGFVVFEYAAECASPGLLRAAMRNVDSERGTVYELESAMGNASLVLVANDRVFVDAAPTAEPSASPTAPNAALMVDDDYENVAAFEHDEGTGGSTTAFTIDVSNPILWVIVALFVFLIGVIFYLLCFWRKGADRDVDVWGNDSSDSDSNLEYESDSSNPMHRGIRSRNNRSGNEIQPLIFLPPPSPRMQMPNRHTI